MLFIDFCLLSKQLSQSHPRASSKCLLMATLEMQLDKVGCHLCSPPGWVPPLVWSCSLGSDTATSACNRGEFSRYPCHSGGSHLWDCCCDMARTPKQNIVVGTVQLPQLGVLLTGVILGTCVLTWCPELSPVPSRMPPPLWVYLELSWSGGARCCAWAIVFHSETINSPCKTACQSLTAL